MGHSQKRLLTKIQGRHEANVSGYLLQHMAHAQGAQGARHRQSAWVGLQAHGWVQAVAGCWAT